MKLYAYVARDSGGRKLKGVLEAANEVQLIQNLREHGYTLISLSLHQEKKHLLEPRVSAKELAVICRQLSTVLRVGMPILQGIKLIQKQVKQKRLKEILVQVEQDLKKGDSLTEAFQKHSSFFPPLFIRMLYSAEMSGNIEQVLKIMAENFQKEHQIKSKIKKALIYPSFILGFALVMAQLLILFALPTFMEMFERANLPLPMVTKLLIAVEQGLRAYGLFILLLLVLFLLLAKELLTWEPFRKRVDYMLYHAPLLGRTVKKLVTFRFSQTLRDLYASGLGIEQALQIAAEVVNNSYIVDKVSQIREEVHNGLSVAAALQQSGVFPDLLVSMIQVGEETGDLETLLTDVAEYNQFELEQEIEQMIALIEPILLILVGMLVASIIVAILLPMYDSMLVVQ